MIKATKPTAGLHPAGEAPALNGRELLAFLFLASILTAAAGGLAAAGMFVTPAPERLSVGSLADFPISGQPTYRAVDGHRVFVVHTGRQLIVLDALTPFAGHFSTVKWIPINGRFEDPEGGSKFTLIGEYIEGPAPRGLDRYPTILLPDGTLQIDLWQPVIQGEPQG